MHMSLDKLVGADMLDRMAQEPLRDEDKCLLPALVPVMHEPA